MLSTAVLLAASVVGGQASDSATKEHLKDLECLIGTWVCEDEVDESAAESPILKGFVGKKITARSTYAWVAGEGAITNDVELDFNGEFTIKTKCLIGWDPLQKQIIGHVFTNRGGCWTQRWGRQDGNLVMEFEGVNLDGDKQSSRWIHVMDDNKGFTLHQVNRMSKGKPLADTKSVYVRQ
jgi:hypothetical protein